MIRALLGAALSCAGAAAAADKPLWELGLGVGTVSFPEYRGSDRHLTHALPVPYFVYRGDFLKADRKGLRGVFLDTERAELNLSLAASLPVDSDGDSARRGMPELDPTVELGPSLDIHLWRSADRHRELDLRLPLRWAFTTDGRNVGTVFSPRLNLDVRDPFGQAGWNLGLLAGPIFTDRRNNAYFYEVAPAFATPDRPAYRARGGYGGTQFLAAVSKRYERFWVGGFLRYDTLAGAVFEDSPLVRRDSAWAAGFGVAWIVGESSRRVTADE